ncbi:MAG: hypothetical protein JSV53_11430, partial [candidate division WOR-3 bacterium]
PKVDPVVYVFDMIYFEGTNLSKKTLKQRKTLLCRIQFEPPFYRLPGEGLTDMKRNYASELKKGHEGIVIKKLNSPYLLGTESPIATQNWRKIK